MLIGNRRNPFKPGAGRLPPELAGRREVTSWLETELQRLKLQEPDSAIIILTGPRGCGKTALLAWLAIRADDRGIEVVDLDADALRHIDTLAAELAEPQRGISGRLRVEGSLSPGLGGIGGAVEARAATAGTTNRKSISHILRSRGSGKPLILIVDEAHEILPSVARVLFTSYQAAAKHVPLLLAVAGTPDLLMHLDNAQVTFQERVKRYRIGRIDDSEAFRALAKPLKERGIGFDEAVLSRATELAQNYPYFLQCWGEALWDAEAARIDALSKDGLARLKLWRRREDQPFVGSVAFEAAKGSARTAAEDLYASKLREFQKYRMRALAVELALTVQEGQFLSVATELLIERLATRWQMTGEPPPRCLPDDDLDAAAEQLLLHTGFVWQPKPKEWEFGIPSLADHAVRAETRRVAETIVGRKAVPIVRALLTDPDGMAGSRKEVACALLHAGATLETRHALAMITAMEHAGIVGPSGETLEDGTPEIRLQTPRFLRKVLEQAEMLAAGKQETAQVDELHTL